MSTTAGQRLISLRSHWFVLAAAAVAIADGAAIALDDWSNPSLLEAGLLFDLCVVIPALYLWCYRARGKAALLRAVALACLGMWIAGHIVPDQHHQLLSTVGFARYIGLGVLLVIEIKLVAMVYRAAFRSEPDAARAALESAEKAGMPEWVARLMAWEASLWRRAWDALRRVVSRR